jgi:hypothetical protein
MNPPAEDSNRQDENEQAPEAKAVHPTTRHYARLLGDLFALRDEVVTGHADNCYYGLGKAPCTCGTGELMPEPAPPRPPRRQRRPSGSLRAARRARRPKFDLTYRPLTYWPVTRDGRVKLSCIAPELPDGLPEEVEIARVELDSATGDTMAVTARRTKKFVKYAVIDEYGTEFTFRPRRSELPLTFGELIALIDSVRVPGNEEYVGGLVMGALDCGVDNPSQMLDFVNVSSRFYRALGAYYAERVQEWVDRQLARDGQPGVDEGEEE